MVSIAIATYNRGPMAHRAALSALSQTYRNIEVIVSDDHSPDNTLALLGTLHDPRLRVHAQPANVGVWENWTTALSMVKGRFLVLLCDDDRLSDSFVAAHLEAFQELRELTVSFSAFTLVDTADELILQALPPFGHHERVGNDDLMKAILDSRIFLGSAMIQTQVVTELWNQTREDDWVADYGLLLRLATQSGTKATAVDGCSYFKTQGRSENAHNQLCLQHERVTRLMLDTLRRITPLCQNPRQRRLLINEAYYRTITLSRHHARTGNLERCRRLLWNAAMMAPGRILAWSQLVQAYFLTARLIRTARAQSIPVEGRVN